MKTQPAVVPIPMPILTLALALSLAAACVEPLSSGGGGGGGGGADGAPAAVKPVDHGVVTETTTQALRGQTRDLDAALEFIEASELLPELLGAVPWGGEERREAGEGDDPGPRPEPGDEEGDGREDAGPPEITIEVDRSGDDAIEELMERILIASTIEEDTDDLAITYRIDGERVCEGDEDEGGAPGAGGGPDGWDVPPPPDAPEFPEDEGGPGDDEDCLRFLRDVPVRVRVTSPADGAVDLSLLVGADEHEVVRLEVRPDSLAVRLDLGALKAAAELALDVLDDPDDDEPRPDLPDVVEGVVRAELVRNAPRAFTTTLSIVRAVRVEQGGDEPIAVRVGATPSLVSFDLDGAARRLTAQLGLGEVEARLPYQWLVDAAHSDGEDAEGGCRMGPDGEPEECFGEEIEPAEPAEPAPDVDGTLRVFLAGLTGRTTFTGERDRLEVTDITLGARQSSLSLDGETLVAIDLNEDAGRKLAAELTGGDGQVGVSVSPELDFAVTFALHRIADDLGGDDEVPPFMLDESLGLRLDGADRPAVKTVGGEEDRQVQVAKGALTLWSTAMAEDVVIREGQCVVGPEDEEELPEGAHPLFGGISGQACGL